MNEKESGLDEPSFYYNSYFEVTMFDKTKVGEKVGEKLTENQIKILTEISKDNSITAERLAERVSISKRKVEENISKLKKKGIFHRDLNLVETSGKTVGKTVGKILTLIEDNPEITREELSAKTGLTIRGVEWNLAKLKQKGILKRIGHAKGGHWKVETQ